MSDKKYPSDKQDQFIVRLPEGMRDRIKLAAAAHNRSMNAEIVATLEAKYPPPRRDPNAKTIGYVLGWITFAYEAKSIRERVRRVEELNRWLRSSASPLANKIKLRVKEETDDEAYGRIYLSFNQGPESEDLLSLIEDEVEADEIDVRPR